MINLIKILALSTAAAVAAIITLDKVWAQSARGSDKPEDSSEASEWVAHSDVPYGKDPAQAMDVYVPAVGAKHPTILLIHGGGWISGDKAHLTEIAQKLAAEDFTVANINYRLATATTNHYPTAVDDARLALAFLKSHASAYKADPAKVGAFGLSAGANIALELGVSQAVQAVVDFYGPTNFADPAFLSNTFEGESNGEIVTTYLGATLADKPGLYREASPMSKVTAQMPPTIIFHGENDHVVPVEQSTEFYRVLAKLKVVSEVEVEPATGHGFLTNQNSPPDPYLKHSAKFLHANLH